MLAKMLQPLGKGASPQVRTTTHNKAGGLAPCVGVNDSDLGEIRHSLPGPLAQSVERKTFKLGMAVFYGYNMQSST